MNQLDIFSNEKSNHHHIIIEDGEYILIENYYDTEKSISLFNKLLEEIEWEQEYIKMYGKEMAVPRLSSWYGEKGLNYTYSGITHQAHPWNNTLLEIKNKIEKEFNLDFSSVLLNLYRDGNDSVSWHADDEQELGKNPIIVSLSLGESRKFQLRHNESKERIDIDLHSGSLMIMKGSMQHYWKHQIPKTKRKIKQRINLTFRLIK